MIGGVANGTHFEQLKELCWLDVECEAGVECGWGSFGRAHRMQAFGPIGASENFW